MRTVKKQTPETRLLLALRGALLRTRLVELELRDKNAPLEQIQRLQTRCRELAKEIEILLMGGAMTGGWQ